MLDFALKAFSLNFLVPKWVWVILFCTIMYLAYRLVRRTITSRIVEGNSRYKARKFMGFAFFLILLLTLSIAYSDKLGSVTVALGVAGAGIAFALQEVIVSTAGWLAILFGRFYSVGDRIQLGGIKGDVIDISVLRTTLMETGQWVNGDLYNGRIVRVANSFVFKEPVFNYSSDFPFLWDEIVVPIAYGSSEPRAREIIENALSLHIDDFTAKSKDSWKKMLRTYPLENAKLDPMVTLSFDENWLSYTARYVVSYKGRRTTKDIISRTIYEQILATGGLVKIASLSFNMGELPPVTIQSQK